VVTRPAWCANTGWGEKVMFTHQAQHAPPRSPDPGGPQPGPDLAMPLAMERAGGEDGADLLLRLCVRRLDSMKRKAGGRVGCAAAGTKSPRLQRGWEQRKHTSGRRSQRCGPSCQNRPVGL
jgi:hypothetical protein